MWWTWSNIIYSCNFLQRNNKIIFSIRLPPWGYVPSISSYRFLSGYSYLSPHISCTRMSCHAKCVTCWSVSLLLISGAPVSPDLRISDGPCHLDQSELHWVLWAHSPLPPTGVIVSEKRCCPLLVVCGVPAEHCSWLVCWSVSICLCNKFVLYLLFDVCKAYLSSSWKILS